MSRPFSAIVLAAGQGTRMRSPLPKILHPVAGIPMIQRVIEALKSAGADEIRVVVGFQENLVRQVVEPLGVTCYKQNEQKGTADAVRAAQPDSLKGDVIIMNGDHPLVTAKDLTDFLAKFRDSRAGLGVATAVLKNPAEFGRIVRHKGELRAIVEVKDAAADTLKIREVNTGIYAVKAENLLEYLPEIKNFNKKGEYYLTDLVSLCQEGGEGVTAITCPAHVALGVNNQKELANATRKVFLRKLDQLMELGVMVINRQSTYVEDTVEVGPASVLFPGVYLRGKTKVGSYCVFESNCHVVDSIFEDSVQVRAGSYIESALVKTKATLGPYARLRPQTEVGTEAHIGNFVELKKVKFGDRSKAGHLTYLGDAEIGKDVNIGCGTITCNYAPDKGKYKTLIGDNAFVGSDTQFIAPVKIGAGAVIGSGSTITKDVPAGALAVARGKQVVKEGYAKRLAEKSEEKE